MVLSLRGTSVLLTRWAGDVMAECLCDYGESLPRVLRAFVVVVIAFALFYAATGSLACIIHHDGRQATIL